MLPTNRHKKSFKKQCCQLTVISSMLDLTSDMEDLSLLRLDMDTECCWSCCCWSCCWVVASCWWFCLASCCSCTASWLSPAAPAFPLLACQKNINTFYYKQMQQYRALFCPSQDVLHYNFNKRILVLNIGYKYRQEINSTIIARIKNSTSSEDSTIVRR